MRAKEFTIKEDVRELLKLRTADKPISPPRFVYHATPSSNVPSIMTKGLVPRADNLQDRYDPAIYVTGSEGDARRIASQLRKAIIFNKAQKRTWKEDYAILKIDTTKIPNHKFYVDGYFSGGGYTKDAIPPEAIEQVGVVSFEGKNHAG